MRYRRVLHPGATYFFTVNLQDRRSKLLTDEIDKLRFSFRKCMFHYPFMIDAIIVLPGHLHVMMTLPKDDSNYSLRWNLIKGSFSKQIPIETHTPTKKHKRERGIWQKRFWEHLIRDDNDYERHINYIHYNPVKHGYVTCPTHWPYSSIHRYIQEGKLPHNWSGTEEFSFGEH